MGRPKAEWDGMCRSCGGGGPFYGAEQKCKRCRYEVRKARESTGVAREQALARGRREASARHARRRAAALAAYGGRCTCCGETQPAFLVIDHTNGGGNAHRRSLSPSGRMVGSSNFYRWLEANGYPDGFGVLCHNCNFAKSHGGCPHDPVLH